MEGGKNMRRLKYGLLLIGTIYVMIFLGGCTMWRVSSFVVDYKGKVVPAKFGPGAQFVDDRSAVDRGAATVVETQGRPDYVYVEKQSAFGDNIIKYLYVNDDRVVALVGSVNSTAHVDEGIPDNLSSLFSREDRERLAHRRETPSHTPSPVGLQGAEIVETVPEGIIITSSELSNPLENGPKPPVLNQELIEETPLARPNITAQAPQENKASSSSRIDIAENSSTNEKDILKSFEMIKAATEVGVNILDYRDLVSDVKVELNMYEREVNYNTEFFEKAKRCYGEYDFALFMWDLGNRSERHGITIKSKDEIPKAWQKGSNCIDELYNVQ